MKTLGRATPTSDAGRLDPLLTQPNTYATAAVAISATSMTSNRIPNNVLISGQGWVVIDAGTTEAEARKITAVAGNKVTWSGGLTYAHAAGDAVMFIDKPVLNVKWWGATGDGSTDDATAINRCAAQAYALGNTSDPTGFGTVYFPSGTYAVGTSITVYGFVRYLGEGRLRTVIKLAASANTDVLVSNGFSTFSLTGDGDGGTTLAHGIPIRFAIEHMTIDGNKANNTSGYGMKLYGMGFYIGDIYIHDTAEIGYYSELQAEGEDLNWWGIPQAEIMRMVIRNTDGTGFLFRGPHDANIDWLTVSVCAQVTGDNIIIDNKTFSYATGANYAPGSCDIGFVHSTGSGHLTANPTGGAISFTGGGKCRSRHLIADSPRGDGYYSDSTVDYNQISILQAYKAGHSSQLLAAVNPGYAKFYNGATYTDLTDAIDGSAGTDETVSFTTTDKIYIGYTYPFNVIDFDLGATLNAETANTVVKYYDSETSAFVAANAKDDFTQVSGATWAKDGRLEYLMPRSGKWAKTTIDSVEAYWVELTCSANLTADVVINEITVRYQRWNANIRGQNTQFGSIAVQDGNAAGGVYIRGTGTLIGSCDINGRNTGGTGLVLDSNRNTISGYIRDYDDTGGLGMKMNERTALIRNIVNMHINNCTTGLNYVQAGGGNEMHFDIYENTGQTAFTGVTVRPTTDKWYFVIWSVDDSQYYYSEQDFLSSAAVSLTSTTQQLITINHDLMLAPKPETVPTPLLQINTAVTDWAVQYIRLYAVSTTQIQFHIKLSTASATGGATAHLLVPRVMV